MPPHRPLPDKKPTHPRTTTTVVARTPGAKKPRRIRNWLGIIYTIVSATIIIAGTYFAIRWAKGDFRLDQSADLVVTETGSLFANSVPKGAEVYVGGKLTGVTDNIIYLAPGSYQVEIKKDGYNTWTKTMVIEKALVAQTNATLFPFSPSLTSLTFTGVKHPLQSPDGNKIMFYLDTALAKNKNGLYVLDLTGGGKSPRQISDDDANFNLDTAQFLWSPDSNDILVVTKVRVFLLSSNSFVNLQSSPDVELQLPTIFTSWEEDLALREKLFTEKKIASEILATILDHSVNAFLSPDNTKILYTATAAAEIATGLMPVLPAPNPQPQVRILEPGNLYVYDAYEDRNYHLGTAEASTSAKQLLTRPGSLVQSLTTTRPLALEHSLQGETLDETLTNFSDYYGNTQTQSWQWLPNSTHLVGIVNQQVVILNYDGTNPTIVYSGPFADNFVVPNYDANSILILTTFNPDSPPNLYAIELKR
jgi:hypothetical protein